jgi:hypothetical protein
MFEFEHFYPLLPTTPTVFPQWRQQRQSFSRAVIHNAENLSALWATMRKNDRHCRQQRGTFLLGVGNNREKYLAFLVTMQKNCHNAEQ